MGFHVRLSDLQQRKYKGSLIVKAISTALNFTNHYSFLDTQTRRCNLLLILVLILEASQSVNQRPSSYRGFGYSVEDCQRFKRFGDDFRMITFSRFIIRFWTLKREDTKIQRFLCQFSNRYISPIHICFSDLQTRRVIDSLIVKGIFTASGFFNSFE